MKVEPLKNKLKSHALLLGGTVELFEPIDVKLAVKWLKEELKHTLDPVIYDGHGVEQCINEAFKDVFKEEESSIKTVGFYYKDIKSACEFWLDETNDSIKELKKKISRDIPEMSQANISGIIIGLEEAKTSFRIAFKDVLKSDKNGFRK